MKQVMVGVLFLGLCLAGEARGATLVVATDSSGSYKSIQAALNAAASGDTVYVRNGAYQEGSKTSIYSGILSFTKSVTLVGQSLDGVKVTSSLPSADRTTALLFNAGTYTVEVRNLTFLHNQPGTEGGNYAYSVLTHGSNYNTITGTALIKNCIFRLPSNHAKTLLYSNSNGFANKFHNITVDFGSYRGDVTYENYTSTATEMRNTIIYNVSGNSTCWASACSGTRMTNAYSDLYGASSVAGTGNIVGDPKFVNAANGDYHLGTGSPCINTGDPAAAYNDSDGSRADMGAYGGTPATSPLDADKDGYDAASSGGTDCNDSNAAIHPGATDVWYDGVDADCAGNSDYDADKDGYNSASYGGTDCDDTSASVHPGASDAWYDGKDTDCAGNSDYDADADGYDSTDFGGDDCDDGDLEVNPGALESWYDGVDQDCAADSDYDADGDGFDSADFGGNDCNDVDLEVNPGALESWYDGVDQDCAADSDFDADGDGFDSADFGGDDCDDGQASVSPAGLEVAYDGIDQDCSGGDLVDLDLDGYAGGGGSDCDDTSGEIHPGASEVCGDGVDSDCSGSDLSCDDVDQDGDGMTENQGDCDDARGDVYPGASEACDQIDQDCDGQVDEGVQQTYYQDVDQDGAGGQPVQACSRPDGHVLEGGDCDDSSPLISPNAMEEICSGVDEDCDGPADDRPDQDQDGYDQCAIGVAGADANDADCNDLSAQVNPGAAEQCNGLDEDCDGLVDEGLSQDVYLADADVDGFGDETVSLTSCAQPGGYVPFPEDGRFDCDDQAPGSSPDAEEVCGSGEDEDCDGLVDELCPETDDDGDGYSEDQGDCDDAQPAAFPGNLEVSDGLDNDCDGGIDNLMETPSPTPEVTPDVTPTLAPTPEVTDTPELTPTATPEVTDTPALTPTATPEVTETPEATPEVTPTLEPVATPTAEPKPTDTPTAAPTDSPTEPPTSGGCSCQNSPSSSLPGSLALLLLALPWLGASRRRHTRT